MYFKCKYVCNGHVINDEIFSIMQHFFFFISFHELGVYDVPATIDYILEATGQDGLYIIGHSRGTTQTFAMLAEKPDYNKKVMLFFI